MTQVRYPDYFTADDYHKDLPEVTEKKVEALLRRMTVDEKCRLLGGSIEPAEKGKIGNAGYQWGVPRLGIPECVMYDGPAGITGIVETTGLPQPSLLGCTWDDEMAYLFGEIAATELSACSGNFLLAPQVDVIRSPHFGRNKDMKSEDSYLAARMAVQETRGVQDHHAAATLKHYAVANTMGAGPGRMPDGIVDEQTLHETYLRPFEAGVREGGAGSVMCSYNIVNGDYCSANRYLLQDVLRDMWGFQGSVMSDWGAVHTFALNKGLDLEMPYGAYQSKERILRQIRRGELTWEQLDMAVRHVLYGMAAAGLLSLVQLDEAGNVCDEAGREKPIQMEWRYEKAVSEGLLEENAEKAARICAEGIVLAKNEEETLPLDLSRTGKTVLLGLGAKYPICGELQERSYGRLERMVSAQEAIEECTGIRLPAEPGIDYCGETIPAQYLFQDDACAKSGLIRTYGILPEDRALKEGPTGPGGFGEAFHGEALTDEDGEEIHTGLDDYETSGERYPADYPLGRPAGVDAQIDFTCGTDAQGRIVKNYRNAPNGTAFPDGAAYTWKGYLKAPEDGEYTLILEAVGGEGCFFIQDEKGQWILIGSASLREWTQWPWDQIICTPEGMDICGKVMTLKKDHVYPIVLFGRQAVRNKDLQIRAAWSTPSFKKKNYENALLAASQADTIVYFANQACEDAGELFPFLMSSDLDLSPAQKKLFEDVAAARKKGSRLIVVLQTSNAKAVGAWEKLCDALLITYMPGQEGTRVIAKILTGALNPSGKLSQTWPKEHTQTAISDTPEHLQCRETGLAVDDGYRIYYDEGIFTGYRWNDKYGVEPAFAFGHGLSYTTFSYSNLETFEQGDTYAVQLTVTNTGKRAGDEVVQLYLGKADVPSHIQMAEKQLAGYERLKNLSPGESRQVTLTIDERSLCYWDPAIRLKKHPDGTKDKWRRAGGRRAVYVGASSRDIRLEGEICVKGSL